MDNDAFEVKAWTDEWGDDLIVTLMIPSRLAEVAADALRGLREACSESGNDERAAELAGLLVGLLEEAQVMPLAKGAAGKRIPA